MDNNNNNYYDDPYNTSSRDNYYYESTPTYQAPTQTYQTIEEPKRRNVAALVLSIVSLVCGVYSILLVAAYGVGVLFGIGGIITRNIAIKKNNGVCGNMAKAGYITSIIGLILAAVIVTIIVVITISTIVAGGVLDLGDIFHFEYDYDINY